MDEICFLCLITFISGGNLSIATSMRAAEYGIRIPDSILAAYSPFNMQYIASPSRLFSLMDPLLPTSILGGCLAAYAGMGKKPFDECAGSASKTHTGKSSKPVNAGQKQRRKSGSFLSRQWGSKGSKHDQQDGLQTESLPVGSPTREGFHTCNSSLSSQNGSLISGSQENSKQLPLRNGICQSQVHTGHSVGCNTPSDVEQPRPSSLKINNSSSGTDQLSSSVNCLEMSHSESQKSGQDPDPSPEEPSLFKSDNEASCHSPSRHSTQGSKHGGRLSPQNSDTGSHVGVHYQKDGEECVGVNIVEDAYSPTVEPQYFPLEESFLKAGVPSAECEAKCEGGSRVRATSMSQVSLPIARNPFMSPLLASDEMLATLPPVDLVVSSN